ncbi:protein-disulfide reductase DsbD [Acidiphilium sp.]|uniref:protein-disulfide reductase DsbD family protein n=1 Tax=Acidiphilium sp. TaxID=527 RepID=UPI002582BC49|nr:protein-disulfide reductase DsbD domain-containing protein [Acidiphilium sp.]
MLSALGLSGLMTHAAAGIWDRQAHGAARLIAATEATGSGTKVDIGLQLRLTPGWHTYWRMPGDAGIAPTIDWQGSDNLAQATIAWPAPQRLPTLGGLETIGYMDGVTLPVTITLARPGEPLHLRAEIDYASCKDICIPYHASLELLLPAGVALPGAEAPQIAAAQALVPGSPEVTGLQIAGAVMDGQTLAVRVTSVGPKLHAPDMFVEGIADGSAGRPEVDLAEGGRVATLRTPIRDQSQTRPSAQRLHLTIVDGGRAVEFDAVAMPGVLPPLGAPSTRLGILGLALVGGLILNLMPCVLPVLSMKLLALVGYAGGERRLARLGLLATAAGILASFAVLAGGLIALKAGGAAIGWGIQFQQPWFLAAMALATTLFAASMWDWLTLALPGGIANRIAGAADTSGRTGQAFLLGAFATLLAASCSAPFVGTAIGFALARGPAEIGLVFAALGLGMAAPFLAAAAAPGLVTWLPRPGPWMLWLRRVLGLALLATAAWLLFVLGLEVGHDGALLSGLGLAGVLGALGLRHFMPARGRSVMVTAFAFAGFAMLAPTWRMQAAPAAAVARPGPAGSWQHFDQAALHAALANRKIVFVDVTAAWCLTCKVNELTVLDRSPVADRLRSPGMVAMRADWTRPDAAITDYLQGFGRYGVPLDVIYGPGAPDGVALPELLTADAVIDALRRAGQAVTAQE